MLYWLKHTQSPELFYLIKDKQYVVGRKNTDVTISDDQSISRKHAVIKVGHESVTLTDCGSKYGTVHNKTKVKANVEVPLSDADVIKFGVFQSIFSFEKVNVATTGSGLTNEQKIGLKKTISEVGGVLLNNWDDTCIAVTTQEIMLTIKVLHALLDDKPIVTMQYWDHFVSNVKAKKPPPDPTAFKPPIVEALVEKVNLSPNPKRKVLFKDKIFVFPTERIKNKMAELITKTGGSSISWEKQPLTLLQVTKATKNYLFIHNDEAKSTPQSLKEIYQHLTGVGDRTIPIQEIAMAIVLCSCEKNCNPKFNRLHSVFMVKNLDSKSDVFALAFDTPEDSSAVEQSTAKKELIVPGSLESDLEFLSSCKPTTLSSCEPTTLSSCEPTTLSTCEPTTSKESEKTQFRESNPFMPSSSKRLEEEPANISAKRMRLQASEKSTTPQIVWTQTTSNASAQSSKNKPLTSDSSFLKKRKMDDNTGPAPKKPMLYENPFAILRNKTSAKNPSVNNPFAALRINRPVNKDNDNPFKPTSQPNSSLYESGAISMSKELIKSSLKENIVKYKPSDCLKIVWIKDRTCSKEITIDPEFEKSFEEFKNSTVIEVLPSALIAYTSRCVSQTLNESTTKKNFKTFKKVKPKHLQTTIISLVGHHPSQEDTSVVGEAIRLAQKQTKKFFDF